MKNIKRKKIKGKRMMDIESNDVPEQTVLSKKKKYRKRLFLLFFLGFLCIGVFFAFHFFLSGIAISPTTLLRVIRHPSLHSVNGKTNMLLLGIGGGVHEGADLTDTMMIASFSEHHQFLVSLPRDLWSVSMQDKINAAYHYGIEQQRPGGGLAFAREVVSEVTGQSIQYTVLVDFTLFQELIDLVGGVDVDIPVGFTDPSFPIAGRENDLCDGDPLYACRYKTVSFFQGIEHMNGERALMYVRSRHAEGDEGTDFARGRRQQDIIDGLKNRLLQPSVLLNHRLHMELVQLVQQRVITDMSQEEFLSLLFLLAKKGQSPSFTRVSLESELINPPQELYGGRYVLVPTISFPSLHEYIEASLSGEKK